MADRPPDPPNESNDDIHEKYKFIADVLTFIQKPKYFKSFIIYAIPFFFFLIFCIILSPDKSAERTYQLRHIRDMNGFYCGTDNENFFNISNMDQSIYEIPDMTQYPYLFIPPNHEYHGICVNECPKNNDFIGVLSKFDVSNIINVLLSLFHYIPDSESLTTLIDERFIFKSSIYKAVFSDYEYNSVPYDHICIPPQLAEFLNLTEDDPSIFYYLHQFHNIEFIIVILFLVLVTFLFYLFASICFQFTSYFIFSIFPIIMIIIFSFLCIEPLFYGEQFNYFFFIVLLFIFFIRIYAKQIRQLIFSGIKSISFIKKGIIVPVSLIRGIGFIVSWMLIFIGRKALFTNFDFYLTEEGMNYDFHSLPLSFALFSYIYIKHFIAYSEITLVVVHFISWFMNKQRINPKLTLKITLNSIFSQTFLPLFLFTLVSTIYEFIKIISKQNSASFLFDLVFSLISQVSQLPLFLYMGIITYQITFNKTFIESCKNALLILKLNILYIIITCLYCYGWENVITFLLSIFSVILNYNLLDKIASFNTVITLFITSTFIIPICKLAIYPLAVSVYFQLYLSTISTNSTNGLFKAITIQVPSQSPNTESETKVNHMQN